MNLQPQPKPTSSPKTGHRLGKGIGDTARKNYQTNSEMVDSIGKEASFIGLCQMTTKGEIYYSHLDQTA